MGTKARKSVVAALAALLVLPVLALSSPALAAPGAPTLTAPVNAAEVAANPVLSWNAVAGAVKYVVEIDTTDPLVAPFTFSITTANTRATPPNDLPTGTYFWRVRAVDATNTAGPDSQRSFVKVEADAPVPLGPVNNEALQYPVDPVVFSWAPLAGAKTYEIQFDDDPDFTGAPNPIAIDNTSYTPTDLPAFDTTFYWRIRGKSSTGVFSQFSDPLAYSIVWPSAPTATYPPSTNAISIEEVVLDWDPMPGAATYRVQIDPDGDFNAPTVDAVVNSTRYQATTTLPNGSYFWRVAGLSTGSDPEPSLFSAVRTFTRAWPALNPNSWPNGIVPDGAPDTGTFDQVELLTPTDANFSLQEPTFTWSPQRGASHYRVEFSIDENFSPGNFHGCITNRTSFTPSTECNPGEIDPGVVSYWRVQAVDGPGNGNGVFSDVRSFLYDPAAIELTGPADGATVTYPVLTWNAVPGIGQYRVSIDGQGAGCGVQTFDTYNTTYVPESLLDACNGNATFDWYVQSMENDSQLSRIPDPSAWRTFTIDPNTTFGADLDPVTSQIDDSIRPPVLTWQPITDAATYTVYFSVAGASSFVRAHDETRRPVWAYTGRNTGGWGPLLTPGVYDYFVEGYDNQGGLLQRSSTYQFTVGAMPTTVLTSPVNCIVVASCPTLGDTPVLDWEPVEHAGLYLVYLATDPNFTNPVPGYSILDPIRTSFTTLSLLDSLPDSQAGQAIYWFVRPCVSANNCGRFDVSVFAQARAFRKASTPTQTISPTAGQVIADEITFEWTDYLVTGQALNPAVDQEARHYVVQVANAPSFAPATIVDTSPTLDQTTYIARTNQYPDGTLYWRVQAFDGSLNPLTVSDTVTFTKLSPGPTLQLPTAGSNVSGAPVLQWAPRVFANTYQVEVYKNVGSALNNTNRVLNVTTRLTALIGTTTLPAGTYGWRVRSVDEDGNPGAWTANDNLGLRQFTVTGPTVNLSSPAPGAIIETNTLLFQWTAAAGAVRYRFEASTVDTFVSTIATATTDITSFAPSLISPAWPNAQVFWRVHTLDATNAVIATSATRSFTRDASTSGEFTAVAPFRVLDTRNGGGAIGAGNERVVTVTGIAGSGVPASGVSAVVVNVTAVDPTVAGFLTVFPANVARPTASNLNFVAGQTVPNLVTVGVDSSGRIRIFNNSGSTHVIVDIVGFYSNGTLARATRFVPATAPTRILDTRLGSGAVTAGENRLVSIAGAGGVPNDATSVVMNVTAVAPTASGFLSVFPDANPVVVPTASNLNFTAGVIAVPNLVVVPIGLNGDVRVRNHAGNTHVLLDVVGWYIPGDPADGARLNPVTPSRIFDSRSTNPPKFGNQEIRSVQIRGQGGVPNNSTATAVVLNVTVTEPGESGFLTVFPSDQLQPVASNLNYAAGQTVPNLVVARIGANGAVKIYAHRNAHVIVDVVAWFND